MVSPMMMTTRSGLSVAISCLIGVVIESRPLMTAAPLLRSPLQGTAMVLSQSPALAPQAPTAWTLAPWALRLSCKGLIK